MKNCDGGGKRFNDNKSPLELLIPEAMEAEARVWAAGAKKYGKYNWQRGMPWTVVIGCMLRHTLAIMRGEDIDKESGELHAAHLSCNATQLIYYYYYYKKGDDRIKGEPNGPVVDVQGNKPITQFDDLAADVSFSPASTEAQKAR